MSSAMQTTLFSAVFGFFAGLAVNFFKEHISGRRAIKSELREAVKLLVVSLSSALHSMSSIAWSIKEGLPPTPQQIDKYRQELHALSPVITGQIATIALFDRGLHRGLSEISWKVFQLDIELARTLIKLQKEEKVTLDAVGEYHQKVLNFERKMPQEITTMLYGKLAEPL